MIQKLSQKLEPNDSNNTCTSNRLSYSQIRFDTCKVAFFASTQNLPVFQHLANRLYLYQYKYSSIYNMKSITIAAIMGLSHVWQISFVLYIIVIVHAMNN